MSYMLCPTCGEANGVVNTTIFQCRCARERAALAPSPVSVSLPPSSGQQGGDRIKNTEVRAALDALLDAIDEAADGQEAWREHDPYRLILQRAKELNVVVGE